MIFNGDALIPPCLVRLAVPAMLWAPIAQTSRGDLEAEVVLKSREGSAASMKTWRLATDIVQEALRAEGFKGTFHLMGIDKVTWRGVHNPPWKVNRVEGNAVILVIKPPRRGEGECWQ